MNWQMIGVLVTVAIFLIAQTAFIASWLSSQIAVLKTSLDNAIKSIDKINVTLEKHNDIFVRRDEFQRQVSDRNNQINEHYNEFLSCRNMHCVDKN